MNKNKTPTQLMIEAASLRSGRGRQAQAYPQPEIEELARAVAETLMAHVPDGVAGELSLWLTTSEGARALRECWSRAVETYLARRATHTDLSL